MSETKTPMTVVQCWDDGVASDARVIEILRKHNAKATFNLNAGRHEATRKMVSVFKETEVWRLGWDEMRDVYDGFVIANHSLTHPRLEQIPIETARTDIVEGRDRLQQFFGQEVLGFAYPFGSYNDVVKEAVRAAGHVYARTTRYVDQVMPPEDPMAFHSNSHFLGADFWERYGRAKEFGVFYFWGHTYEIVTEEMWNEFDRQIARISADPDTRWGNVVDLF